MPILQWVDAQKEFESWFTNRKSAFVYQFEDAREAMGVRQSRKVFTKGQPSDYLVIDNGVTFFAEVKSSSESVSFALASIRKSQWSCAIQVVSAKGLYFFFIRKEPDRIWYKIPAAFFVDIQNAGVKSVKWKDIECFLIVL